MASSRCRSLLKPTISLFKSTIPNPKSTASILPPRSNPTFSRSIFQLGSIQSLLPLHNAISSARLTSCLGIDSTSSRSLSQGMLCCANPGV